MKIFALICAFALAFTARAKEENPFYFACKEHPIRTDYLYSGFWKNELPEIDQYEKVTTIGLIDRILSKIETRIDENENLIANMRFCYANQSNEYCQLLLFLMKDIIPELVKSLRYHAALAQSNHNIITFMLEDGKKINESLSFWDINKELDWEPLTQEERQKVSNTLAQYIKKANEKIKQSVNDGIITVLTKRHHGRMPRNDIEKKKRYSLMKAKFKHFNIYRKILSQMHLLQFITAANPDLEDIMQAVDRASEVAAQEKKYIEKKRYQLEQIRYTSMNITHDLLEFMDYTSMFEEVLLQNPRYCNLALALAKHRNARFLKKTGLITLPLLASSFLMPPIAAISVGLASGTAIAAESHFKLERARMKYFGYIYGDKEERGPIELIEVSDNKRTRNIEIAIMPIGLGIFGGVMTKAKQTLPSIIKMFSKKKLNFE